MKDPTSNKDHDFKANVFLTLKLEADGKEAELPTGNIEKIRLKLYPFGYACHLQVATFDNDEVHEIMTGPKAIKATLAFKPIDPKEGTEPIIEFKGISKKINFTRLPSNLGKHEQAHRVYEIDFFDPAKITLENHRVMDIFADMSMKDVMEKHCNPELTINYKWDHLEVKHPVIAFNLEEINGKPEEQQANFYSFLIWYLQQENGILEYDFKEHNYTITGKKKEASGPPLDIPERFVIPPRCILAQNARYNERTLKHTSHTLDQEDKENEHSFKGVRRETSAPNNYRISPEQTQEKMKSTLFSDKNEVEVYLKEFKKDIQLDKLTPGSFVCFKGDKEGNWTQDACFKDKNFRIRYLEIDGNKIGVSEEVTKHIQAFNLSVKMRLEEEEAAFVEWPPFVSPTFPFYREGFVFCDIGDKEQSTYQILESEKAPQGQYVVHVPIDKEIKKVVAPFVPYFSGQHFFPFIKETKVRLSLYFHTAKILGPIDWDDLVRLPAGVQGNQLVLASNGKDKYTVMRHEYMDGKDSFYTVRQSSSEVQVQTIEMKEKDILITVDEKDKKTLSIQLNHDSGFILSLEDKDAGNLQQIVFDGTSLTHTCKGSDGTSTIVQKPDSVSIECKKFSIKSETISMEASDCIMLEGKNKFDVKTKVANIAAPAVKLGN